MFHDPRSMISAIQNDARDASIKHKPALTAPLAIPLS